MSIDLNHLNVKILKKHLKENPKNFIALVGAGLSRPAGIPSWTELKTILLDHARARVSEKKKDEQHTYLSKLERIEQSKDYWRDFSNLKLELGSSTYEYCIKDALNIDCKKIPENYELLWKLNISGILTTNLDTLAADSYASVYKRSVDLSTGINPSKYSTLLQGDSKYVLHLHGNINDSKSWIFTKSDLEALLRSDDYINFLRSAFTTRNIIMLGIGTEDFSFQYLFTNILNSSGKFPGKHFAIFPSPDENLIKEYEEKNISIIPYIPEDDSHSDVTNLLKEILNFNSIDTNSGSVYKETSCNNTKLTPEELMSLTLDEMRIYLNSEVACIIKPSETPTEETLSALESFYKKFTLPIHNAWLLQPDTIYDSIFNYKITRRVGKGAFGQVYEATSSKTNQRYAIKILLPELKDHRSYLNSFRRGVRSMNILTSKNIEGMVKIHEAYEIPACIVMDFIDGPTLRQASQYGFLSDITICLNILFKISSIVKHGHDLEELVLHRDLKPDNIILQNYYCTTDDLDVIVLDFDLSWHKGALDLSIVDGARSQGYAAPEQTASYPKQKTKISTRNTAVDVFGLGMVTYFVLTGCDPRPNEHNFKGFQESIREKISEKFNHEFKSLPNFISNFIYNCTLDTQEDRISFSSASDTIKMLFDICQAEQMPSTHPLLLLEIATRLDRDVEYEFHDFNRKITLSLWDKSKTLDIYFSDEHLTRKLSFSFQKLRGEYDDRNIGKYLEKSKANALATLKKFGFTNQNGDIGQGSLTIKGDCNINTIVSSSEINNIVRCLQEVRACLDLR